MVDSLVLSELFNARHRVQDHVLEFIIDDLWDYEIKVTKIENYDMIIYLGFKRDSYYGDLRIDRLSQNFDLVLYYGDERYLPMSGDWKYILSCISVIFN